MPDNRTITESESRQMKKESEGTTPIVETPTINITHRPNPSPIPAQSPTGLPSTSIQNLRFSQVPNMPNITPNTSVHGVRQIASQSMHTISGPPPLQRGAAVAPKKSSSSEKEDGDNKAPRLKISIKKKPDGYAVLNKPDDKKPVTATKSRGKKKSSNDSDEKGPKPKKRKTKAEVAKEKKEKEAAAAAAAASAAGESNQKIPASQQPYAPPNYSMPANMIYPNNMNIRHQMPPNSFFNQPNMPNFNMNQIYRNQINQQQPPQLTPKPGSSQNSSGNNFKNN